MTDEILPATNPSAPAAVNPENPNQPSPRDAFIAMLPESLRSDGVFANFHSVEDLAKSYASAAKMVGMDKGQLLQVPRDDSKEAWDAVYSKLGRPEAPDKYNFEAYKDVASADELKPWAEMAHGLGLNQKQVDGLFSKFFGDTKALSEQKAAEEQARYQAWSEEVNKELGLAKDRKLNAAVGVVEKEFGEGALDFIQQNPQVFKDPRMVKALVNIADKMGESSVLLGDGSTTNGALSPADALQQLSALRGDPTYMTAMRDKAHPQHDYYVNMQNKLFEYAYPGNK